MHWERALAPLIEAGYLAIVHGGGKEGAYLAEHPRIDTLHVTGSDKTYDAIVWGAIDGRAGRGEKRPTIRRTGAPSPPSSGA